MYTFLSYLPCDSKDPMKPDHVLLATLPSRLDTANAFNPPISQSVAHFTPN
jgi:hypothetical protein